MPKRCDASEWALVLAPEPPFPIAGGGPIRTASLCAFLAARRRVHLVTFGAPRAIPRELAEATDWIELPRHGRGWVERVIRNAGRLWRGVLPLSDRFGEPVCRERVSRALAGRRYGLAVIEHFWCAGYREAVGERAARVVLDLHNIESDLHERCGWTEAGPARWAHRRFARLARRAERTLLPRFDLVLATSQADRDRLEKLAPGVRIAVYPNALPPVFPAPAPEEHCVAFSGNLEYHPNVTAVRFFAEQVWPRLRRRDPSLRWRLIGKNEHAVRRWAAADPRIELTGPVEDALAELARAKVVVAPLLAGSGTRIKILEAWAARRAVVSTRVGAEGLPAAHGENLLLADSPEEMEEAILGLLRDERLRRRIGAEGRRLVEERFCWPAVWPGLEQCLRLELGKPPECDSRLTRTRSGRN